MPDPPDAPIFLVGAPRSGTSALYKALCLRGDVAWISNWVARYPAVPQLAVLNRAAARLPARQRAVWFRGGSEAYVYGARRAFWERAFPMPVEGEPVYRRALAAPGAAEALRRSFSSIRRYGGGRGLVSKRIANNRRVPLLVDAFPQARFVEIVRDGRAVACSLSRVEWWPHSRLWWHDSTPAEWQAAGGDPWELCARSWVEELGALEKGLARVPEPQVLTVRYERFVAEPVDVLEEVARFGGLGPDPAWRRRLDQLRFPDRNDSWRRTLSADEVATVERVQGDALRRLGYAG